MSGTSDDPAAAIRLGVTRLSQRLRSERSADSLSSNKLSVLSHLNRHGACTPGEIAAAEHQQPQSLTRVFAQLQSAELVDRTDSARDGRASVLRITRRGRAALAADMAQRDRWLAEALHSLRPAEVAVLVVAAGLLDQLADLESTAGTD